MDISLLYQNTRGLRTKTREFRENFAACDNDIICITESWLNHNVNDKELFDDRFLVVRKDRDYSLSNSMKGGGCAIAFKKNLNVRHLPEFETTGLDKLEDLWIQVRLPNNRMIYICTMYVSPFYNNKYLYDAFFAKLKCNIRSTNVNDKILLVGDFNCPGIKWQELKLGSRLMTPNSIKGDNEEELIGIYDFLNLNQLNFVPNVDNNHLDLILTSMSTDDIRVLHSSFNLVVPDVLHPVLELFINENVDLVEKPRTIYNFRKANYNSINEELSQVDWSFMDRVSVARATKDFYKIVQNLILKYVPSRLSKNRYPVWYSSELIGLLRNKLKARRKYIRTKSEEDYRTFSLIRSRCKATSKTCYSVYISQLQNDIPNNLRKFWAYTKSLKQSNSYPSVFKYGEASSNNPEEIVNYFSDFFQSNYSPSITDHSVVPENPGIQVLHTLAFSEREVKSELDLVDVRKNGGPDGISNLFLRSTSAMLAIPLSKIFTKSINEGCVPDEFKLSSLTPIHKKGAKSDVENYRLVSILNAFAKIFEKLVHRNVYDFTKNIIKRNQHGFFKNRSTISNLANYTHYLSMSLDNNIDIHAIYTDFRKAFDRINHSILLKKLFAIGIRGAMLRWFTSYLSGRIQYVVFNGSNSHEFSPTSGVPQGSILGPLLFNIFINDLGDNFESESLFFADDMKLYRKIRSMEDCLALQRDLDRLSEWCERNFLELNICKCQYIIFSHKRYITDFVYRIGNVNLTRVTQIKDLGVIFDSALSFNNHIDLIVRKALKNMGFLMRVTQAFTNMNCVKFLYNAIVRSHLEYCSQIWTPSEKIYIDKIDRIQYKFTRYCYFRLGIRKEERVDRLSRLNMKTLEDRRTYLDIYLLHKILNDTLETDLLQFVNFRIPGFYSRLTSLFSKDALSRTEFGRNTNPIDRLIHTFVSFFPMVDMFATSHKVFKSTIAKLKIVRVVHQV